MSYDPVSTWLLLAVGAACGGSLTALIISFSWLETYKQGFLDAIEAIEADGLEWTKRKIERP